MNCVYTIGHSTRPVAEFLKILEHYKITLLVDIRTVPRSRHMPAYNLETLPTLLKQKGIKHAYMDSLGGLRKTNKDSLNKGWRNLSFRGYADYMQTKEFKDAITELIEIAQKDTVAIMCAEAVPWRCHRSLVGDALLVRGVDVLDIFNLKTVKREAVTSFAKVKGTNIIYPPYEE